MSDPNTKTGKLFKTRIVIEVLSDDGPYDGSQGLEGLAHDITDGPYSGMWDTESSEELTPKQMADALKKQGSAPDFFGLDDDGNEVE
jgi:hypothetical protein